MGRYAYATSSDNPITELVALEPNLNLHPMLTRLISTLEAEQNAAGDGAKKVLKCPTVVPEFVSRACVRACQLLRYNVLLSL